MCVGVFFFIPPNSWVTQCPVQSEPEHRPPLLLMHSEAPISMPLACTASKPTATLSSVAPQDEGGRSGWGCNASGMPALCSHDCALLWQKQSEGWERERERVGAVDAVSREAVNIGSCVRWGTEESGRLTARVWEVAANSAKHRRIRWEQNGQSEGRGGVRKEGGSTGRLVPSGRGVNTAEQLAITLWTTREQQGVYLCPRCQMTMSPSTSVSANEGEQVAWSGLHKYVRGGEGRGTGFQTLLLFCMYACPQPCS